MDENYESQSIDLNKIWRMINYRKYYSLFVYVILILLAVGITFLMPKKYTSEARILFNRASSTNLADINPFILDKAISSTSKSISSILSGGSDDIFHQLEIIKSPLVMDEVIKENKLVYGAGPKEGELISTDSFLRKEGLSIKDKKDTNVIKISYESINPQKANDIVMSIINNYQSTLENINGQKAKKDKEFLATEIKKTEIELEKIQEQLKNFKKKHRIIDPDVDIQIMFGSRGNINPYKKSIAAKISAYPEILSKYKKLELKQELNINKYKLLKEKYEWAFLVESMSKNATNISILKYPKVKRPFENSSPNVKNNLITAFILAIILSSVLVVTLEIKDPKLSYLLLNTDDIIWMDKNFDEKNLSNLFLSIRKKIDSLKPKKISIIGLNLDSQCNEKCNNAFNSFLKDSYTYELYNYDSSEDITKLYEISDNSMAVILVGKIGQTDKTIYNSLEEMLTEDDKLLFKVVIS